MVLLEFTLADGARKKCDARCYNDKQSVCACICFGANHGKGIEVATQQTAENWQAWRTRWNRSRNRQFAKVTYLNTSQVLPFEPSAESIAGTEACRG